MNAEQIATEAARKVLNDNRDNLSEDYYPEGEPLGQLGWEMGAGVTYESALRQIVAAAIEADRAQREHPMSDPLIELREWASTVSQFMAEDKSNDWREEIAQLEVIEGRLDA